jgi:hypothetical protein
MDHREPVESGSDPFRSVELPYCGHSESDQETFDGCASLHNLTS